MKDLAITVMEMLEEETTVILEDSQEQYEIINNLYNLDMELTDDKQEVHDIVVQACVNCPNNEYTTCECIYEKLLKFIGVND